MTLPMENKRGKNKRKKGRKNQVIVSVDLCFIVSKFEGYVGLG